MDPDLRSRLQAFARDCVFHGDMTPMAQRMLDGILELYPDTDGFEGVLGPVTRHVAD